MECSIGALECSVAQISSPSAAHVRVACSRQNMPMDQVAWCALMSVASNASYLPLNYSHRSRWMQTGEWVSRYQREKGRKEKGEERATHSYLPKEFSLTTPPHLPGMIITSHTLSVVQ